MPTTAPVMSARLRGELGLLVLLAPLAAWMLPLWFGLGLGCSLAQIPAGRLLRRSARREDRPYLYAAQFALSHACLLLTYPLAGWLGASAGLKVDFAVLGLMAAAASLVAILLWPSHDPEPAEGVDPPLDAGMRQPKGSG